MLYILTYKLAKERPELITELQKSRSWWHYLDNTWLISTDETANQLWNRIAKKFTTSDSVLITQFNPNSEEKGWLPEDAWKWIREHKND